MKGFTQKGGRKAKTWRYYVCKNKSKHICDASSINAEKFEKAVIKHMCEEVFTCESLRKIIKMASERQVESSSGYKQEEDRIRSELKGATTEIRNLVQSALKVPLSTALAEELQKAEDRKLELESRLAVLNENIKKPIPEYTDNQLEEIAKGFITEIKGPAGKRVIDNFVNRIEAERGFATVYYSLPLNTKPTLSGGQGILPTQSAPGVTRTRDPLLRKQVLYPN